MYVVLRELERTEAFGDFDWSPDNKLNFFLFYTESP